MKGYTDFYAGFLGPITPPYKGGTRCMDWEMAEKICIENPDKMIYAGLREDWNNTSGIIFDNGKWVDGGRCYGCSSWATPIIDIEGEEIECWKIESDLALEYDSSSLPTWWGRGEELINEWKYRHED